MADILFVILVVLVTAYLLSELFKHFGLPRVLGQILAGIFLGIPVFKNYLFDASTLSVFEFLTNIGIILLFFFVGLEINIRDFQRNAKESAMISIFNTVMPLFLGFIVSRALFDFDNLTSLIIGIALAVSSQAISLDILEEAKLLKSKIGNLIMTSGTVDDVFELIAISTVLVIFEAALQGQASIYNLLFNILVFTAMILLFRVTLIPFALRNFERDRSHAVLFMGALIIVLFMAYLSQIFGVSSLIGALVAGMLVRHTLVTSDRKPWEKNNISHSIHVISFGFLIPIFFVNVGLQTNIQMITSNFWLAFVLLVVDIVGTLTGTIIGVRLSKGTFTEGMIVGWAITPKGDTELVIASLALAAGLITVSVYTAIITVAIASTFIAPIVFKLLIKHHPDIVRGRKAAA
jgi:Kef-type K+ transport system membrane component KefB